MILLQSILYLLLTALTVLMLRVGAEAGEEPQVLDM